MNVKWVLLAAGGGLSLGFVIGTIIVGIWKVSGCFGTVGDRVRFDVAYLKSIQKFYADYSSLTPDEIEKEDEACAELFKNSKPSSR